MFETSSLPVLEPDKAEIIDLDHLQPLGYRIKDKLDPILRQLDGEVVGQGVPVTVRYLHSLVEKKSCIYSYSYLLHMDHYFPLSVWPEIGFESIEHSSSIWGLFFPIETLSHLLDGVPKTYPNSPSGNMPHSEYTQLRIAHLNMTILELFTLICPT